jgi:hypothetical protein
MRGAARAVRGVALVADERPRPWFPLKRLEGSCHAEPAAKGRPAPADDVEGQFHDAMRAPTSS